MDGSTADPILRALEHPPELRAAERRLEVPVEVLRAVGRRLGAVAADVAGVAAPTAPGPAAGPAAPAIAATVRDVDAAVTGLARRLADTAGAMRATADDLGDTDAQVAQRLLGGDPGTLFATPTPW